MIKNFNVQIVPKQGQWFYMVVGGFTKTDAWSRAQQMYPDCSVIVLSEA